MYFKSALHAAYTCPALVRVGDGDYAEENDHRGLKEAGDGNYLMRYFRNVKTSSLKLTW